MTLTINELKEIAQLLPKTKIIAIHMGAINRCSLTKSDLLQYIDDNNLEKNIVVPKEGDKLTF
ncbi:hypothetical protein KIM67_11295 [Flagellimonas sp. 389]|uniref:hypothetical protein n=1 Tax=Flagellimonas sp. 389 TaxID=2835862 RepID=UPI001BD5B9A7|nr:hypothetical protein [Flagellimonas sp. 389]MBS9462998.1 hypothetical protein [Flagellimonas sp. 389]